MVMWCVCEIKRKKDEGSNKLNEGVMLLWDGVECMLANECIIWTMNERAKLYIRNMMTVDTHESRNS